MHNTSQLFIEAQKHHQAQRFTEAEKLYRRVVDGEGHHVDAWYHLGLACIAQNKIADAAEAFARALAIAPQHVDALTQLGIIWARQNRLAEAVAKFREALALRPGHAKAHNNMGVALTQMGRLEEGLACYREAARLQPDYAEAHFNLGIALGDRQQHAEAIACYECALQIRPDYADVHFNLGLLLVSERRSAEAVICLEQAARLQPDRSEAHNNLGLALADAGRFEDAVASCDTALRLKPFDAKTHMNRSNALASLGRIDEAIAGYGLALRLQPNYANARWNRSLAWLSQGDFERGWAEYGWRWQRAETKIRRFPEPPWEGSSLAGKTILLWCEQGLGDTLQFVRYAALLKERGATVWLECPAKMVPLLARCRGVDRVLPEGEPLPPGFDCQAPLMSLPFLCGTALASVPGATPYLSADPARVEHSAHVQTLDLVITCDSALAHLAGALGRPVWNALSLPADWRWLQDRDDTPWYPTMQLFRQPERGDRRPVFAAMRDKLGARREASAHELAPYFQLLTSFDNANAVAIDLAHNVFLAGAVLARKPEHVLELGIGSGYVTNSLLHALRFNRQGRLTSVDNWFDWNGVEPAFVRPLRNAGANVVVADEEAFVRAAADDAYDLLVSDADHFHSGAWIDQHLRIVKHDGFLFFHDTNQPDRFPTLAAIEERIQERGLPYFHFKESSRPEERCQRGWLFVINKKS